MEREYVNNILKVKERVIYIYNRSQEAIDSDEVLIRVYKGIWGDLDKTDGITRVGRLLRSDKRDLEGKKRFFRSVDLHEKYARLEKVNRQFFGKSEIQTDLSGGWG